MKIKNDILNQILLHELHKSYFEKIKYNIVIQVSQTV